MNPVFFGRPNLIDQFYGVDIEEEVPLRDHSVTEPKLLRSGVLELRGEHQDAENSVIVIAADTEYGAHSTPSLANGERHDDESDSDTAVLPLEFEKLFAKLDGEPKAKKKRKKTGE